MTCLMTITDWERGEWSRFATAAYKAGHNKVGNRYSAAAAIPKVDKGMVISLYDRLMADYRRWLVFNEFPNLADAATKGAK